MGSTTGDLVSATVVRILARESPPPGGYAQSLDSNVALQHIQTNVAKLTLERIQLMTVDDGGMRAKSGHQRCDDPVSMALDSN